MRFGLNVGAYENKAALLSVQTHTTVLQAEILAQEGSRKEVKNARRKTILADLSRNRSPRAIETLPPEPTQLRKRGGISLAEKKASRG